MIRIAFAVFLVLHGIAHGVGFAGAWRLGEFKEAPVDTTVVGGRFDVGTAGTHALGIVWLLTGIAYLACAVGVWRAADWWPSLTVGVTLLSLGMSVLGWPDARIGVGLDAVILIGLAVMGFLRTP